MRREESNMARCSKCGKEMGSKASCPHCGGVPSQSVLDKGVNKMARTTGTVLEKGIKISEDVVKETAPIVKTVLREGRKGLSKAKNETLRVARSLKEEGK